MITELAHFCLILALIVAIVQSVAGIQNHFEIARRAAFVLCFLCAASFAGLIWAYATSDFTVLNVALNSHSLKPLAYKIAAAWGNHEGSMLLWILILAIFGVMIARLPGIPDVMRSKAVGIQGLLATGFIAFSYFTSNPFLRTAFPPFDGQGLNPVLQDPGLVFHPPTLYIGYVGFSSVFSLAAAALLTNQVNEIWAKAVKPFVVIAWAALSAGIALGSAWAYYELGWGGWWFWDPVENASLLPWLTGTALLHSLLVLEARGALKRWTIFLAVLTFSLSLLGTFLVRSGVLTSVHTFANDPARGVFILALLAIYCGGALALYAWRAPALKTVRLFAPVSRETSLVANNLLLVTIAATVLSGTLYPLLMDALNLGQISVGPPYYYATVIPVAFPLLILMAVGPFLPWKRPGRWIFKASLITSGLIVAGGLFVLFLAGALRDLASLIGISAAIWVMASAVVYITDKKHSVKSLAAAVGHFGLGLAVIGMLGTILWRQDQTVAIRPGDTITVGRHTLFYKGTEDIKGPNYHAARGIFDLTKDGKIIDTLHPEKRYYPVADQETTEAAIRLTVLDDLYVVLGDADPKDEDLRLVTVYVHPFASALWSGFMMIVSGGFLALRGRRKP